jgi:DNA-directed RNA polymerase subunit RPC12/RpoP
MFGLGKHKVRCTACGSMYLAVSAKQGTWAVCPNCGAKTTTRDFGGLEFHATISAQQTVLPASLTDVQWLKACGIETIPETYEAAHSLARGIRYVIEKALSNVFLSFPCLERDEQKELFTSVYKSGFFDQIPLRPEDQWDAAVFTDELKVKMIKTIRNHLDGSAWEKLRLRKFGPAKGCYAWSVIEVVFTCPNCDQKLRVEAEGVDLSMPCPTCRSKLTVPPVRPVVPTPQRRRGKRQRNETT